jgi:hypothetical protein
MHHMLRFRPSQPNAPPGNVADLFAVGQLIDDAMQPGHFFVAPELRLTWIAGRSETIPWEIFRGRLLDANQTRLQMTFLSWHVLEENATHPATEPTISVKLDVHDRQLHVTRGLLAYVWEGYDAGGGVIESRETVKWTRELVGTIRLEEFADLESVRDELICLIWQAIVGTSRLPLTSVEAPLPAFSFGQLHYLYRTDAGDKAITSWVDLLRRGLQAPCAWREAVKLVEFALRHIQGTDGESGCLNEVLRVHWPFKKSVVRLLRALFNNVSLSPYTRFVENALTFGDLWWNFDSLLVQLCRHMTAYDLVTFHHRGANYPDALLLDAALRRFVWFIASCPFLYDKDNAESRRLRRPLRQACLMRRHYEGHLVPDTPTSPGENTRVLPASHPRVPEEQLTQTLRRHRQLFADEPLPGVLTKRVRSVLAESVRDLKHPDERLEMGIGLFIDRPLGYAKQVGEPDLTPLLAHEAFSPSLARRRWGELEKLCAELAIDVDAGKLDALFANGAWPAGLPHTELADCPRPVAALGDVRKVADDFVILRTKPVGLAHMLGYFDLTRTLRERHRISFGNESQTPRLCVQAYDDARQPVLALYDEQLRRRVELRIDVSKGYVTRAGVELPRAGLSVVAVWEDTDDPVMLRRCDVD